jgi:hypothetical protein
LCLEINNLNINHSQHLETSKSIDAENVMRKPVRFRRYMVNMGFLKINVILKSNFKQIFKKNDLSFVLKKTT